ncbi:hypothetical protein FJT64_014592 [Amphibalanus amphitrite]|uniref:Uncharacterized protein n=1 Tax=Amphibalanus amphitrite TaxID=1232801 RepID=A0A6A4VBD1_AMPAM|nr:hypothetical protein FJT64_014592 [Amphibalanus amphitrite]
MTDQQQICHPSVPECAVFGSLQHCRRRRLMLGARINLNLLWEDMRAVFSAAGGPTSPAIYRPTGETEALQNAWNELRELATEQRRGV